jgi:hypothetical protein
LERPGLEDREVVLERLESLRAELGEPVEVVDLDEARSGIRRGIAALVRKGDQEYSVGLAGLEFLELDPVSADWLDMYRYWLRLR